MHAICNCMYNSQVACCITAIAELLLTMLMWHQALGSYEQAAKLQSNADIHKQKIANLKKQIQRQQAGKSTTSPKKQEPAKSASNFAFGKGYFAFGKGCSSDASDPSNGQKQSKILAAPNVGEIKNDDDYAEAKKNMVRHSYNCCVVGMQALCTAVLRFASRHGNVLPANAWTTYSICL